MVNDVLHITSFGGFGIFPKLTPRAHAYLLPGVERVLTVGL